MGQIEVYEFLKRQRELGEERFWSCREVEDACRQNGFSSGMLVSVRGDLVRLEVSGYLDAMIQKLGWRRTWRIKAKYVIRTTKVGEGGKGEK